MKGNAKPRDYRKYEGKMQEYFLILLQSIAVVVLLSMYFYHSIWAAIPLIIVGAAYFRRTIRRKTDAYREKMIEQFRECMLSVATAMKAGYAVENAFMESREDMRLLYGENSAVYKELELIRRGLVINISLEELLNGLAERSASEEIEQFAEVFCIAKRNSGNMADIMESTALLIGRRVDTQAEILNILGAKQTEWRVMKVMPFAIMTYISLMTPGFFDGLYHNLQGITLMTGCLVLYLGAYVCGEKMLKKIVEDTI